MVIIFEVMCINEVDKFGCCFGKREKKYFRIFDYQLNFD